MGEEKIKKVMIGTPSYDGRVDVWYTNSLVNAIRLTQANNIFLHPIFVSYDALIQRARNDTIKLAIEGEYDYLIFIDSDLEFDPQWILDMLESEKDVIGGTYRKKTDTEEIYVAKTKNLTLTKDNLIKTEGLGTGFVCLSQKALKALWDASPEYKNEGKTCRMVCNVEVVDGELYSEDIILFKKLSEAGFDIWLDPKMTCNHVGTKKFVGSFKQYMSRLNKQLGKPKNDLRIN